MTGQAAPHWPGNITGTTVHLWLIADASSPPPAALLSVLGSAERTRAERLMESARGGYLTQRCLLRMLIGRYLDKPPASIRFASVSNGKPCLGGELAGNLQFNLSDTGGVFSIGFATAGSIGVDMERRDRSIHAKQLSRRICAPSEKEILDGLSSDDFRRTLIRLWVRKEAVLKGLGHGLRTPMRLVSVEGDSPVAVTFGPSVPDVTAADKWHVSDIDAGEEFLVSFALPFLPDRVNVISTTVRHLVAMLSNPGTV